MQVMLPREDARSVTILALIETLLIDLKRTTQPKTRRDNAIVAMQEKLEKINETFIGKVEDDFIEHCDRYLCIVQDATDSFFDAVTKRDRAKMKRVKGATNGRDNQA